jgi:hypothetical protein
MTQDFCIEEVKYIVFSSGELLAKNMNLILSIMKRGLILCFNTFTVFKVVKTSLLMIFLP